jgi:hypothetical protein
MFFSDQGMMGFGCRTIISELQRKMHAEKQTDSLFQEGIPDRKTFLNFMSQAAEQVLIPNHSEIRPIEGLVHEDQTEKEPPDFLEPKPKEANPGHFFEIPTKADILHDADSPEKEPMSFEHPEKPKHEYEKSVMEPFLSKGLNVGTENPVSDHLELVPKGDFIFSAPENQIKNKYDTGKDNTRQLHTFLKHVLFKSKNSSEVLRPEVNFAESSVAEIFGAQAGLKHRIQEPKSGPDPKELINLLSNELENKPVVDNKKSDLPLKVFFAEDTKITIAEHALKNVPAKNADANLQVIKESGNTISNPVFPTPPILDITGAANNLNPQLKQVAIPLDQDAYRTEHKVLGQVVARLFTGVRQGSQNMTIHLYPPELGKVKVRIVSDKGDLNVRLYSMKQQVGGILEKYLPLLQQSLEDQGIVLSDLRVSVESGNEEKSRSDEQEFLWENREFSTSEIPKEKQVIEIFGENTRRSGPSQGLSLRV